MKALPLFLFSAALIAAEPLADPFADLWTAQHEARLEKAALELAPQLQKHTVMIGRLGLLEIRPGVIISEKGDLLAPYLAPIDTEDDAPYLLYFPDGSRQVLELITEKPERGIAHLRASSLPEGLLPAERADDVSLQTSQWFLIPVNAPVPHLGEPMAFARDHSFERPGEEALVFTLARGPYPGGTPVFDLAGRLLAIQTVPNTSRGWDNQPRGRVFTLARLVEDFAGLADILKSPAEAYLPKLPRNPYPEDEQDDEQKENKSPLEEARAKFATSFFPAKNPPFAVILNEGKAITHSVTGVIVRSDGLLLTKASELGPNLSVRYQGKTYPATLLSTDEASDLALIGINARGLPVIQWSDSTTLKPGTTLVSPILLQETDNEMSGDPEALTGAFSHPLKNSPTIHETSGPASLGIITEQSESSLKIASFRKGAPAKEAGLKVGDELTSLNGEVLTDRASLVNALKPIAVGSEISLEIRRGGNTQNTKLTLIRPHLSPPPTGIDLSAPLRFIPSIRRSEFPEVLVHTLPLDNWDCGSPLYTTDGKVIGLNIASVSHNRSIALPPQEIKAALKRLLTQSRTF
ncbi:MAG: PDZ domain-containing protein [Akkermansiaceae bacterium]